MTPIQACEETRDLWTMMARVSVEEKKVVDKQDIPGSWQNYLYNHYCPCCEYVGDLDCSLCPMFTEWRFYSHFINCPCEGDNSPYEQWKDCYYHIPKEALCIDVEFFCLLIAEMAEEAIERHIAESHISKDANREMIGDDADFDLGDIGGK